MDLLIAGKMFTISTGRILFILFFVTSFVIGMIYSYRKDAKNHKKYYKDTARYVAIALVTTILVLVISKIIF